MKITSVNNELVKETAKLLKGKYREELGCFLIEGEKGVYEALEAGIKIKQIFVQEGYNKLNFDNIIETNEAVLSKISDAKSAPKIIAVAEQLSHEINKFKDYKRVVLLEGIKDAGNLGTILRTACAFNIDGVVLYGDTVDLYNPKTVRSAVGNLWKIPVVKINDLQELKNLFSSFERIATLPKGKNVVLLDDYKPIEQILIMFGSEADGLSEELKNYSTKDITIEMSPSVESLNLSISAGIIMHKIKN